MICSCNKDKFNIIKTVVIWVALLFIHAPLTAEDESGGTESPFALGAGGRGIAMGGANAAVWGGSYSLLWNPAGLNYLERSEINLFHTSLFDESSSYSSFLGSYPFTDIGTVSFGVLRLDISGIERRDIDNLLIEGETSNQQTRYLLGYARNLYKGLSGGFTMKLDRYAQGPYSASGFGMDIGFGLQPDMKNQLIDGASFGLTFINILQPNLKLEEEESGDPYGTRAGFALWRPISARFDDQLLLAVDMVKTKYDETRMHIGCEYSINGMIAARSGWDAGFPTFGFGVILYSVRIDYAYRGSDLDNFHLFSLSSGFGRSKTENNERRKQKREKEIREEIEKETAGYELRQIENHLFKAREAIEKNLFREAAEYYKTVLLWDPENQEAISGKQQADGYSLITTADSLFGEGRYGEALLQYRAGNEFLSLDAIITRINSCEELIGQTVDRRQMIENMFAHALELYSDRDWAEAVSEFNGVLELQSDHNIARSYRDKAETRLKEEYSNINQQIRTAIGNKRYGAAINLIRAGLEKYTADEELEKKLIEVTELKKRADLSDRRSKATKSKEISLSKEEENRLRSIYENGAEHFKKGKFDKAIEEWEKVWNRSSEFEDVGNYLVRAYLYWGMELYTRNDYKEALEIWGMILKVDPDNEKAIRYIRRTREELSELQSVSG